MVATFIQKIALEMRFVGVHVFVSTQLGNTKTGVSTALKPACVNCFLVGPNASGNQRANAFSAPDSVAEVPERRSPSTPEWATSTPAPAKSHLQLGVASRAELVKSPASHVTRSRVITPTKAAPLDSRPFARASGPLHEHADYLHEH